MAELKRGLNLPPSCEIHFPHDHVSCSREGTILSFNPPVTFQVSMVCHVTHKPEAEKIQTSDYCFQPKEKLGRLDDHNPSYRCTLNFPSTGECYQRISSTEAVFPGRYSWWGLWVTRPLPPIELHRKYQPGYLKDPPQSFYGSQAFVISFSELLQLYAASRRRDLGDICLRMGGTLRYKGEKACVVIVCTSHDLIKDEELKSYNPITYASRVFDPNGLVDANGRVINIDRTPQFTTRNYKYLTCHYETLNFAFYLENNMICRGAPITIETVKHFCIHDDECPEGDVEEEN